MDSAATDSSSGVASTASASARSPAVRAATAALVVSPLALAWAHFDKASVLGTASKVHCMLLVTCTRWVHCEVPMYPTHPTLAVALKVDNIVTVTT